MFSKSVTVNADKKVTHLLAYSIFGLPLQICITT